LSENALNHYEYQLGLVMKILVKLDDYGPDFDNRAYKANICIIVRPNKDGKLEIKEVWPAGTDVSNAVLHADDVNLEFIGHSSRSGKTVQSEQTNKYSKITVGIDKLSEWIENTIPQQKMPNTKITMLCCEAAADTKKYESIAEQMLRLFKTKPNRLIARKGFVYTDKKIHSHGHVVTALYQLSSQKWPISKKTPTGEKFIFFYSEESKHFYKVDAHLYKFFNLLKKEKNVTEEIAAILNKDIQFVTKSEFKYLIKYVTQHYKNGKILEKAEILRQGQVYQPAILHGDNRAFKLRDGLNITINQLMKLNESSVHNKELIEEILQTTRDFINYRTERNYNLRAFPKILSILTNVITNQDGKFSDQDIKTLRSIKQGIEGSIDQDSEQRYKPTSPRPPSHFKEIKKVTKTKNSAYAAAVSKLLSHADKIDTTQTAVSDDVKLKIKKEIFDQFRIDNKRREAIQKFPPSVKKSYHALEKESLNISLIWADMQKVKRNDVLEIIPNLRLMRTYLQEAQEQIFNTPTNEGAKEALQLLKFKMNNALKNEPVFKKQNALSRLITKSSRRIGLFIARMFNSEAGKQLEVKMRLEEQLEDSHLEVKKLFKKRN